jgi:hypothetical protein
MAIPQDGLGAEQVEQIKAYEATAELVGNPDLAAYVDADALKQSMEEALTAAFEGGVAALAGDQGKLKEFVEAVKTEASTHDLSALAAKVEAELERIGQGAGAGSGTGSGAGDGGSPTDEGESHEGESHEGESHEGEHHEPEPEPEPQQPEPEPESESEGEEYA